MGDKLSHAALSAALQRVFGLGTLPVLLATGLAAERLQAVLPRRALRPTVCR